MNSPFEYEIELKYLSKEQLIRLVEESQERIDKAIEYINKGYYKMNLNPVKFSEELLSILRGEDNEN